MEILFESAHRDILEHFLEKGFVSFIQFLIMDTVCFVIRRREREKEALIHQSVSFLEYNNILIFMSADDMSAPSQSPPPLPPSQSPPPPPSPAPSDSDIIHASNLIVLHGLAKPGPKRPALPPEIILQILSDPSRWIRSAKAVLEKRVSVSSGTGSVAILFSPPLTSRSIQQLRKVVFTFKSRDQGWSSFHEDHGTYENSWTWFDAMVGFLTTESPHSRLHREGVPEVDIPEVDVPAENVSEEEDTSEEDDDNRDRGGDAVAGAGAGASNQQDEPPRVRWNATAKQMLQANRHASRVAESYRIELEAGEGILAELREGWEIALWASAQFPGWVNHVEEASMELWEEDAF